MRQRPNTRYQLLGPIEAQDPKRRMCEARLQVRAAIMGADAVIDVQEEVLPDFSRTVRRVTGTAVRAVDPQGRFEFRARWYADRVARICTRVFAPLAYTFLASMIGSIMALAVTRAIFLRYLR